jgi:hypothetical protein
VGSPGMHLDCDLLPSLFTQATLVKTISRLHLVSILEKIRQHNPKE